MLRPTMLVRVSAACAVALGAGLVAASPGGASTARHGVGAPVLHLSMPRPVPAAATLPKLGGPVGGAPRARRQPRANPTGATVFYASTTTDSPLATPGGVTCTDAADGSCSLRAAIEAANNLGRPVVVMLGASDYALTDTTDGTLTVTDPGGLTVEGVGEAHTTVDATALIGDAAFTMGTQSAGPGELVLSNLTVTGGTGVSGGAIQDDVANGVVELDTVSVTGNTATSGGGIYCHDGDLWINNSSIENNTALDQGGGIYEYWCNVWLTGSSVSNDHAVGGANPANYGAGLYEEYGLVHAMSTAFNGDVVGSNSVSGYGGGIADYYGGMTILGSSFNGDQALDSGAGAGIYVDYGSASVSASQFVNDLADGATANGAAISAGNAGFLELHGISAIHDTTTNTQLGSGGAIYAGSSQSSTLVVLDGASQVLDDAGGGLVLYSNQGGVKADVNDTTFAGDSAGASTGLSGAGGVFAYGYQAGGIQLAMSGDIFFADTDAADHTAGAVMGETFSGAAVALDLAGGNFDANQSSGNFGTGGLAVYASSDNNSTTASVTGTTMFDNSAPNQGYGGALAAVGEGSSNATLQLAGDNVYQNSAGSTGVGEAGFGGGVFLTDYAQLVMSSTSLVGNVAFGPGTGGGEGGGLFDNADLTADVNHSYIRANHATGANGEGGGVWSFPYYGALNVSVSTISRNYATFGGGLYTGEDQVDISQSTIVGNGAGSQLVQGQGGGLYNNDGQVQLENSTVTGNTAIGPSGGLGGGLYTASAFTNLFFTTVAGNSSALGSAYYSASTGASGVIRNSILEGDCSVLHSAGVLSSAGGNVLGSASCVVARAILDTVTSNAVLSGLANNGGPTMTMAIGAKSPAVGLSRGACLPKDQRGKKRPTTRCDVGAYQR